MSVSIRSTDDILAALREHKEWRDAVRREITDTALREIEEKGVILAKDHNGYPLDGR